MCLKRVLALYKDKGWRPVIAPELEFYLVKKNLDPDYPLDAAVGRTGRKEPGGQAYGIDAANDFDPIVEDIYDYCEAQELDVDTLSHESGPGPARDQLQPRRSAGTGRPGVPVQAHRAPGGPEARRLRHLHGQAARE